MRRLYREWLAPLGAVTLILVGSDTTVGWFRYVLLVAGWVAIFHMIDDWAKKPRTLKEAT